MNKKAKDIVDKAIAKAIKERDRKGYRENLGYDQRIRVRDEVGELDMHYIEKCDVMAYFDSECDKI